jgi:hypothetical protein
MSVKIRVSTTPNSVMLDPEELRITHNRDYNLTLRILRVSHTMSWFVYVVVVYYKSRTLLFIINRESES